MGGPAVESMDWCQIFGTSWKMNPMTFVVFRGLLASVVVGHQLAHALDYRNQGWFYFIYFTHWTMILGAFSECLLFYLSIEGLSQKPSMRGPSIAAPKLVQITLILWHIVHPFSLIVRGLFWTSWLLEHSFEDLQSFTYMDFYTHGFGLFWLLLSFIFSNVPFSMCTGFRWCVTYSLVYIGWTLVHFYGKIGTPTPCDNYPQKECPIYTKFDWHKPQLATIVGLLVCLVACPVVCTFYATLAARCRGTHEQQSDSESKTEVHRSKDVEAAVDAGI